MPSKCPKCRGVVEDCLWIKYVLHDCNIEVAHASRGWLDLGVAEKALDKSTAFKAPKCPRVRFTVVLRPSRECFTVMMRSGLECRAVKFRPRRECFTVMPRQSRKCFTVHGRDAYET